MVVAKGITPPRNLNIVKKKNANTQDIIDEILAANRETLERQVADFSKQFAPTYHGLRDLWHWVKNNIYYQEDPNGVQWIREPARLYADDEGDCKSFTVFITAVLKNMGLGYTIRFVTYDSRSSIVTHVYPIAYLDGQQVIMDAVWNAFDSQKTPFYAKKDYYFMEISRLSGVDTIGNAQEQQLVNVARHMEQVTKELPVTEMDLTQLSESQAIKYLTGGNVSGIGTVGGAFTLPVIAVSGVGASKFKKALSNLGKKAGAVIKNSAKKLINALFQNILPKAAPFFLFCFVKGATGKVAFAQQKQMKLINWLAKTSGTSPAVVLASVAKGITQKYKMTPTQVIHKFVSGEMPEVKGIGIAMEVVDIVLVIIRKLVVFFKKKDAPVVSASDGSDLNILKQQMEAESEDETEEVVVEEEDSVGKTKKKVVKKKVVKKKIQTIPTKVVIEQNTQENIEKQRENPANEVGVNTPLTNDGIITLANPGGNPPGELPTGGEAKDDSSQKESHLRVPQVEKDDNSTLMMFGGALLVGFLVSK